MKNMNTDPAPEQMKQKKPFYKRIWFIVLVVLIVAGIFGAGGSSEKGKKTGTASNDEKTEEKGGTGVRERNSRCRFFWVAGTLSLTHFFSSNPIVMSS